jgi:superfamily II DNA/RNA helicase
MSSNTFNKNKKMLFLGKKPAAAEVVPAPIPKPVESNKVTWGMSSASSSSSGGEKEESWENYDDNEEVKKVPVATSSISASSVRSFEGRSGATPKMMDKPHDYPSLSSSSSSSNKTAFKATNIDDDFLPSASVVNARLAEKKEDEGDVAAMNMDDFTDDTTPNLPVIDNFENMGISENVLRGIYSYGIEKPSPIQQRGIPAGLSGTDMIAQAHSGTGKTLMFTTIALCTVEKYRNSNKPEPLAMIISPTKVLAEQSCDVVKTIGEKIKPGLITGCFIGGSPRDEDVKIARRCDIVTGTTGRIIDLYRDGKLKLAGIKLLILDEADELLKENSYNNGDGETFEEHINIIVNAMAPDSQIIIVSATMTDATLRICNNLLKNPIKILLKPEVLSLQGIRQYNIFIDPKNQRGSNLDFHDIIFGMKMYVFEDIFKNIAAGQTIVFCESIESANMVYEELIQKGWRAGILHGKQSYQERRKAIGDFKDNSTRFLITTDMVARGFDIHTISLVINFDFPRGEMFKETYLHRIGRSGRHGRKGTAINFVVKGLVQSGKGKSRNFEKGDVAKSHEIQKHFGCLITEAPENLSGCL